VTEQISSNFRTSRRYFPKSFLVRLCKSTAVLSNCGVGDMIFELWQSLMCIYTTGIIQYTIRNAAIAVCVIEKLRISLTTSGYVI
jgi:hypothetical protein